MTFLTELERLKGAATEGPWTARVDETVTLRDSQDNQLAIFTHLRTKTGGRKDGNEVAKNARLCALLVNHADVLAELVRAAEDMLSGWRYLRETHGYLPGVGWNRTEDKVSEALDKLNGAEK